MPVRYDAVEGSWWLKGMHEGNVDIERKNITDDAKRVKNNGQQLLHRMFEDYVDCMEDDYYALTEYFEGVSPENMRSMTYKTLNDESNRLARTLIRKLGVNT